MVASAGANLFASCAAGVCSLWGWRHGGANVQAVKMVQHIQENGIALGDYLEQVKRKEAMLMGFGHRVYRSYDPRARILQAVAERLLSALKITDPLFDLARRLEAAALADQYFVDRHLYPNVDFYSGIILRALGIPLDMFTVVSAIGRMPGWIANWKEVYERPEEGIVRPRQVYTGRNLRDYIPVGERG
jgi:citrate synthase